MENYDEWLAIVKEHLDDPDSIGNIPTNFLVSHWENGMDPYIIAYDLNQDR